MGALASIEIGTNSIRMLVAEQTPAGSSLTPLLRKRTVTRLGEGFNSGRSGTLKPVPIARSIDALRDFLNSAMQCGAPSPLVVATGVVRSALNGDDFIGLITEKYGHSVRVLSGPEEARLTLRGIIYSLNCNGSPLLAFDVGGGSTEFIWATNHSNDAVSVELGAVVLTENFMSGDPPKSKELSRLFHHIDYVFETSLESFKEKGARRFSIAGTGGTAVTLAAMVHGVPEDDFTTREIQGLTISRDAIACILEKIKAMPRVQRLNLQGLERGREDIILAGTAIVIKIMDYFEKDEIIISHADLLEGVLLHFTEGEKNE